MPKKTNTPKTPTVAKADPAKTPPPTDTDTSVSTSRKSKPRFRIGRILTNIFLALAVVCFAATVAFAFLAKDTSKDLFVFGLKPYIITSASMSPELAVNSVILIQQVPYDDVKVGDIISYRSDSYDLPVCHRVIRITDDGLITKGDNVDIPDQFPVTSDMFRGKLIWHTNFFAGYIIFVQEKGIFVAAILPAILILGIITAIYLIPKKSKSPRKETKHGSSSED